MIGCLLHDGTGLLVIDENDVNSLHIDEIFAAIDTNRDGRIDMSEFKVFYETVLLPSSRHSSAAMTGKASQSSQSSSITRAAIGSAVAVLSEPISQGVSIREGCDGREGVLVNVLSGAPMSMSMSIASEEAS